MESSHFSPNVINTTTQYTSTESPTLLAHSGLPPHTLPPLQQHPNSLMQPAYSTYPHTPRTPATPNTPGSASTMGSYPPPPTTTVSRGGYQVMASNAYQNSQSFATSNAMMPQSSTALSHPQPIAPAPSPGSRPPPPLRPMPPAGVVQQQGIQSPYNQSQMMPQPSMLPEAEPTHVVGSQGRRGILPSAPGRPVAPAAGTAPAKSQVPQKDSDGKFPCPHCNKTYLHAKHLKRHLLRRESPQPGIRLRGQSTDHAADTGDRPYMCVLCRDTFSRSDILKRHFQKCSIRRGNPTGVSHLSHPHAHVKKNPGGQKPLPEGGDLSHMNGMGNMPTDGTSMPFGLVATPDGMANDQNQLSRANLTRLEEAGDRDRRNMAGAARNSFDQQYNGSGAPNNMAANMGSQMSGYTLTTAPNGMPLYTGQNTNQQQHDWTLYHSGGQDTSVTPFSPNNGQRQTEIQQEPNTDAARQNGVPGGIRAGDDADPSLFFARWGQ